MMKRVTHKTTSTIRETYPWAAVAMAVLLLSSFGLMIYFAATNSLHNLNGDPLGDMVRGYFMFSIVAFFVVGGYWKKLWSFILSVRADRLARRYDYFEITADEWVVLSSPEWSGEIIDFMGLNRAFVHFDNEQDRILFRLGR
jgi:hypothetical protein